MKKTLCSIALVVSLVLAAVPVTAATKVFLLGGQSNMAGCGITAELIGPLAKYGAPQTDVNSWNSATHSWVALQGGFGGNSSYFGPEVSFGYAMHSAFPTDDIYLVKYAVSGAILADNASILAGTWAPNATNNPVRCYPIFKSTVNAALANLAGKNPVIAGMLWMQGESDAYFDDTAAAYKTNLEGLIATVRTDFNTPDMEFLIGQITTSPLYGSPNNNGLVRAAQAAIPGEVAHTVCFSTEDLQGWQNGGHYDTQGQIDLGIRFANEFIQTPEPSSLILAGLGLLALAGHVWRRRRSARA